MKKQCECFTQDFKCNSLCCCIACTSKEKNYPNNNINNNLNATLAEVHDFSVTLYPQNIILNNNNTININNNTPIDYNLPCNFISEAFEIMIKNQLTDISKDINLSLNYSMKFSNNFELNATPKFSIKKRIRSKNESANLKTCPTTNSSVKKGRGLSQNVNKNIKKKKLQLN